MRPAESHGKERTGGRGSSPRRRLVSPLALVIAMVAILFGGYQEFVRRGLQQKRDQFLAIAIAEIPEPGTPGYLQQKKRSHKFVEDFERFRRQHPFSIWSLAAARISQAAEDRVVFLEHLLRRKLTGLLAEAERAEVLGRLDRALELYTRMAERGAGTSWESQAEGRLRELMQYRKRAQELFDLASSTEERGRPQDAFEIYRELLITYPRSEAARRVRLPLRIESTPSGASVHSRGTLLGTTPVLLHVNPYEPLALTLRDDAGHERRLTVENPLGFRVRVSLGSP